MIGEPRTARPRLLLVAATAVAVLVGGTALGACTPSAAGAACAPGELAREGDRILRCTDGRFVAGETLEEFVRNLLKEIEIKIKVRLQPPAPKPPCTTTTTTTTAPGVETDSHRPGC